MSSQELSQVEIDAYREMVDRQAVIDTAIRYTWALDTNDWDLLDQVFVPDGTARFMSTAIEDGLQAIKDRVSRSLGPLDDSQHIVSNHQVTVEGDTATHRCYLHAQHIRHDVEGSPLYVVAGRYEDQMVRTIDGWRIQHRQLISMWTDGNHKVVERR